MQNPEPVVPSLRPEIPEEELPQLGGANRIQWGRMGAAVIGCSVIVLAAVIFEACS